MSIFSHVKMRKPKKSVFNLSHDVKTTASMGKLYPILCEPVLPGDKWSVNTELQCRLAPMLAPVMSRMDAYVHYFFVPNRLVWKDFQKFITGGETGTEEVAFPSMRLSDLSTSQRLFDGSLADFFGIQTQKRGDRGYTGTQLVSALPFKGYQLIFSEFYRDQNLIDAVDVKPEQNGVLSVGDVVAYSVLRSRAWQKDYFSSALPWSQRGPAVNIPLAGEAEIEDDADIYLYGDGAHRARKQGIYSPEGGTFSPSEPSIDPAGGAGSTSDLANFVGRVTQGGNAQPINIDLNKTHYANTSGLKVDLEGASAVTINELRKASRLQEWFEKNARGGSRYIEQIFSHFGVRSSDARLQRPEFLGGNIVPIMTTDVLQTSASQQDSAQANYAGIGGALAKVRGFKRSFEEHGYVFAILSIRPKPAYMQGIKKDMTKFDRFEFGWPEFAQLGEQEIKNKELFFDYTGANAGNGTFGYTPRYAEYKFINNSVHGDFRNSLSFWHLARIFGQTPNLNAAFVQVNENRDELNRIFAAETNLGDNLDHFWLNIHHNIKAVRCLPKYGIPVL